MLYNPSRGDWDWETIDALGLPRRIFTEVDRAGSLRGALLPDLAQELGINRAAYAAVGCHDTASAVAAVPGNRQLCLLLQRYLVPVWRGDRQADPDRRRAGRQFL